MHTGGLEERIADNFGRGPAGAGLQAKLVDDLARALKQATETASTIRPEPPSREPSCREPSCRDLETCEDEAGMPQVLQAMASRRGGGSRGKATRAAGTGGAGGEFGIRLLLSPSGLALGVGIAVMAVLLGTVELTGARTALSRRLPETRFAEIDAGMHSLVPTRSFAGLTAPSTSTGRGFELVAESEAVLVPVLGADDSRMLSLSADLIADGDIPGARALLARAASTGSWAACFALAETYDPYVLAALRERAPAANVVAADLVLARRFYFQALAAGDGRAVRRIEKLAEVK